MFELIERIAVIEASSGSPALRAMEATGEPIAVVSREHVFPTSPRPAVWTYARFERGRPPLRLAPRL